MLRELGYDPTLNPPNYGLPDPEVINNTNNIQVNRSDIQYSILYNFCVRQFMQYSVFLAHSGSCPFLSTV